jgi:hypothetical protein
MSNSLLKRHFWTAGLPDILRLKYERWKFCHHPDVLTSTPMGFPVFTEQAEPEYGQQNITQRVPYAMLMLRPPHGKAQA